MKIVVSPAKSLDFETKMPTTRGTQPTFLEQAAQINRKLETFSKAKLGNVTKCVESSGFTIKTRAYRKISAPLLLLCW